MYEIFYCEERYFGYIMHVHGIVIPQHGIIALARSPLRHLPNPITFALISMRPSPEGPPNAKK